MNLEDPLVSVFCCFYVYVEKMGCAALVVAIFLCLAVRKGYAEENFEDAIIQLIQDSKDLANDPDSLQQQLETEFEALSFVARDSAIFLSRLYDLQTVPSPALIQNIIVDNVKKAPKIFGSAVAFERSFYKASVEELANGVPGAILKHYCPYAYENSECAQIPCLEGCCRGVKSEQIGYDHTNISTIAAHGWYQVPSKVTKDLITNNAISDLGSVQGFWTQPYYDEGGGEITMVTYSHPILTGTGNARTGDVSEVRFVGVVTVDVDIADITCSSTNGTAEVCAAFLCGSGQIVTKEGGQYLCISCGSTYYRRVNWGSETAPDFHVNMNSTGGYEVALDGATCEPCPPGGECLGDGSIRARPGYWTNRDDSEKLHRCRTASSCCDSSASCDTKSPVRCEERRTGVRCAMCEKGYSLILNNCIECTTTETDSPFSNVWFWLFVLSPLLLAVAIYKFPTAGYHLKAESTLFTIAVEFVQLFIICIYPLDNLYNSTILEDTTLTDALAAGSQGSGGILGGIIGSLRCPFMFYGAHSMYAAFYMAVLTYVYYYCLILPLIYLRAVWLHKDDVELRKNELVSGAWKLYNLCYTEMVIAGWASLNCPELSDPQLSDTFNFKYPGVQCGTPEYKTMSGIAIAVSVCYGILIPCYTYYFLYKNTKKYKILKIGLTSSSHAKGSEYESPRRKTKAMASSKRTSIMSTLGKPLTKIPLTKLHLFSSVKQRLADARAEEDELKEKLPPEVQQFCARHGSLFLKFRGGLRLLGTWIYYMRRELFIFVHAASSDFVSPQNKATLYLFVLCILCLVYELVFRPYRHTGDVLYSSFGFGVLVIISGCNVLLTALVYERDHSIKSSDSQEQLNDKIVYYNNFCVGLMILWITVTCFYALHVYILMKFPYYDAALSYLQQRCSRFIQKAATSSSKKRRRIQKLFSSPRGNFKNVVMAALKKAREEKKDGGASNEKKNDGKLNDTNLPDEAEEQCETFQTAQVTNGESGPVEDETLNLRVEEERVSSDGEAIEELSEDDVGRSPPPELLSPLAVQLTWI